MAKISIITTVLNNVNTVGDCLSSIYGQSDGPYEHIIIDGGSTDGTLEKIQKLKRKYTTVISEPDEGIYHGMNKGISLATGDVIGTLNSDDFYAHSDVLNKIKKVFTDSRVQSCYGDLVYIASSGDPEKVQTEDILNRKDKIVRYWKSGNYDRKKFWWGWMAPHPTFFVRREVFQQYGNFNIELGTAADYEIMLRFLVKYRISAYYIPEVLVKMRSGGVSNKTVQNRLRANKMDRQAWLINNLQPYFWTTWMKPVRKIGQWFVKED